MKKTYAVDMIHGPLFNKLLVYAIPLVLSGVLQLLFNAAYMGVVGKSTGSHALAAVGSTSSLINLLVNLFIGFSIGTNVLVARYSGARDYQNVEDTIHTSIMLSLVGGVIMVFIGVLFARPLLSLMGTPLDVINHSVLYMRIYFLGMPAFMLYNFGAAILRAVGDSKRPLYLLIICCGINIVLDFVFVLGFESGVAGVGYATLLSQAISAILVTLLIMYRTKELKLELNKLCLKPDFLKKLLWMLLLYLLAFH